jgi:hypothetical protein
VGALSQRIASANLVLEVRTGRRGAPVRLRQHGRQPALTGQGLGEQRPCPAVTRAYFRLLTAFTRKVRLPVLAEPTA